MILKGYRASVTTDTLENGGKMVEVIVFLILRGLTGRVGSRLD